MTHLFGRISKPSAASRSVERFIASLPVILANPSPLLASAAAQATLGTYGHTLPESSRKRSPSESSSKMSATILRLASQKLQRIYADWATCLKQDCLRRMKLAHHSFGRGSSSWPSPRPCSGERSSGANRTEFYRRWPTPLSSDSKDCGGHRGKPDSLTSAIRVWQTPATDSFRTRGGARKGELGLEGQAREIGNKVAGGGSRLWTTPTAHDSRSCGPKKLQKRVAKGYSKLVTQAAKESSRLGRKIKLAGSDCLPESRRLNPQFVEFLMGFPAGWSDYAALAMPSFRLWLATHTQHLRLVSSEVY